MLSTLRKSPASRSNIARSSALALAALAIVAQLSGYVHLAFVEHTRCAEHGELVDRGGGGSLSLEAGVATVATPFARVHSSSEAEHGHGHDHCLLSPFRRDRTPIVSALHASSIEGNTANEAAFAACAAPRPTAIAVFRLAPKNSPPV